jgi:hypothetical protein
MQLIGLEVIPLVREWKKYGVHCTAQLPFLICQAVYSTSFSLCNSFKSGVLLSFFWSLGAWIFSRRTHFRFALQHSISALVSNSKPESGLPFDHMEVS